MSYRRRASPLHAAGAGAACAYMLAVVVAALVLSSPLALGALALAVGLAGAGAGVGHELRRALWLAVPVALAVMVVNALVTRDGLTVIWRLGELPLLGHTDITLEATVYGAVLGLRAAILILCGALYTLAVDPDDVLRLLRPLSFRSALTATLATRMVPVLARDARRFADAQRCRPGPAPGRVALMRASTAGVLDRALEVAAALEVRGYGAARRPPRARARAPRSRHDLAFALAALLVGALAIAARATGLVAFAAYPTLHMALGSGALTALGLIVAAGFPFLDRRGIAS
jgi:energy-coupling factor transport system permease protein